MHTHHPDVTLPVGTGGLLKIIDRVGCRRDGAAVGGHREPRAAVPVRRDTPDHDPGLQRRHRRSDTGRRRRRRSRARRARAQPDQGGPVNPEGHLELRWAVEAIRVGARARQDVGDITSLVDSIRQHGLLQPLTLSPDGILLCGARRLAALRHLGIKQVQVWVRAGLSTRLQRLFAEQDENTLHQPLRPTEAAALYREVKELLAEDAARRQEATRYGANPAGSGAGSGPANLTGPANRAFHGPANLAGPADVTARAQAARLVTGSNSYTTLERVDELRRIADDPRQSDAAREAARIALERMDQDGKVWGHYRHAKAIQATSRADDPELQTLALQARTRAGVPTSSQHPQHPAPSASASASASNSDAVSDSGAGPTGDDAAQMRPVTLRAFLLLCDELAAWPDRFDPTAIGPPVPITLPAAVTASFPGPRIRGISGSLTAVTRDGVTITLGAQQQSRAATIIQVATRTPGVGVGGARVALMAALSESSLRILGDSTACTQTSRYPND